MTIMISTPPMSSMKACLGVGDGFGISHRADKPEANLVSPQRQSTDDGSRPNETENDHQKAANLLFGGELYAQLLEYAGPEGISHLRDDWRWRKAMDLLPAKDLDSLTLPVVTRPESELDLFLLRSFLTDPVTSPHTGKRCGWKLNDLAMMILTSSPLTSDQMLQRHVYPGCDEKVMSHILVDGNKHLSSSLLQKMILAGCPPKLFERIAKQQNATSEILSAILLRLTHLGSSQKATYTGKVLYAVASHRNTNQMDLQYLAAHSSIEARKGVAKNVKAAQFGLLQALSKDEAKEVRAACASNVNAPKELLVKLSMDLEFIVRRAVTENQSADKDLLKMLASYYNDSTLLWSLSCNKNCCVDEIFSVSNKNHRRLLAGFSKDSTLLRNLVGMDGGSYDFDLAGNCNVPIDALQILAKTGDGKTRYELARNESITASLMEELMQDEDCKTAIAENEATPMHVLELLSVDDDEDVREIVAYNAHTPPEILQRMATMAGQSDEVLEAIFTERYNHISVDFLEQACIDALDSEDGIISKHLAHAVLHHKAKSNIPLEILIALGNGPKRSIRRQLLENPRLPVGDIIRLYHDPDLDKKLVNSSIRKNALLQIAVDKLFRLYFQSKDGVGSDSDFAEGERWW